MPELIEEMTYWADLRLDEVGAGPLGTRIIFNDQTFFVGQGRLLPGPRVEYRVFRVTN